MSRAPIEAAFFTALEHDRSLFTEAFAKNVILVSPSTLLVTLRTIHNIWRYADQNENALEIARQEGEPMLLARAEAHLGLQRFYEHRFAEASSFLESAKEVAVPDGERLAGQPADPLDVVPRLVQLVLKTDPDVRAIAGPLRNPFLQPTPLLAIICLKAVVVAVDQGDLVQHPSNGCRRVLGPQRDAQQ